jgi:GNAT superfamily N-acetyltransferase
MIIDVPSGRYGECLAVLRAAFADVAAEFGLTAANTPSNPAFWTDADLERVIARGSQLFADDVDGRIVCCAFVGPSPSREGTWVLRHLAVVPDARHHGIGASLVGEASRRARAGGAAVLRIGIVADNRRLADWYLRLGFVTVESGRRYPGLVFAVDHLELSLSV